VISLFTNIPLDLALKSVSDRWQFISRNCSIPKEEFLITLKLMLESTFFTFDDEIYRQNFGTPISSPLFSIFADLVMQDLELNLKSFGTDLLFFFRYVDDIAIAVPHNLIDKFVETFNASHPRLQFTLEIGGDRLNFLDVTILNINGIIKFNMYHKSTFSGRHLSFISLQPLSQKRCSNERCR